ncbi:MAG TPA: hypothetical protein VKS82_07230 [Streptosporangiaceae bacterium]|nr:hypothetical protein [Streptosporangiaceae bacterium]
MSATTHDYVTQDLMRLLSIARLELDRHLSDHGRCTRCQQRWPCPTACLAAETLSAL